MGGLYREHRHLRQDDDLTASKASQEDRWRRTIEQWTSISAGNECVVLGDINLDHSKWMDPPQKHVNMVETTKREIETKGFHQIITEVTRAWPGVEDSLIDHIWLNIPEKVVNKFNIIDAESDHNIIGITLRIKGIMTNNQEFKKRQWTNFEQKKYVQKVENIDWEAMYSLDNVDLIWDFFETNLSNVINEVAPIVKVQPKGGYRNWVTKETKVLMHERNLLRTQASRTGSTELWNQYRIARTQSYC